MNDRVLIALGGNALLQADQEGTYRQQLSNAESSVESIVDILTSGYEVGITHGNGPQVGSILLQNKEAAAEAPEMPLFACGAQSQGLIGFMLQSALMDEFETRGLERRAVPFVTPVVVDGGSDAFDDPTKPIGQFYSEEEARELMETQDIEMIEDSGRGWRRVVPSPEPEEIYGVETIREALEQGNVPIAAGGGGVPVVHSNQGGVRGVDAVIDKDLTGARLAEQLDAGTFLILTDVPNVALNYGTPDQESLESITVSEARQYKQEGHFGRGSMYEKVEAACRFVENTSEGRAIITNLDQARQALEDGTGTRIRPD
jgi:carbamate kinase